MQVIHAISCAYGCYREATKRNQDENHHQQNSSTSSMQQNSWYPPEQPFFKINVDASWNSSTKLGYVGIVIRDASGKFVAARKSPLKAPKVSVAETIAVIEGCMMAKQLGINDVGIESDSKETIMAAMLH